jgi:hypothetical protein
MSAQKFPHGTLQGAGADTMYDPYLPQTGQYGLINESFQLDQRIFYSGADQI